MSAINHPRDLACDGCVAQQIASVLHTGSERIARYESVVADARNVVVSA